MSDLNDEPQVEAGPPSEPDVAGHIFGPMNPVIARELARAREEDIARDLGHLRRQDTPTGTSRGSLLDGIRRRGRRSR